MIALEHKSTNCEASSKRLQKPYNLHGSKIPNEKLPDCKDTIHAHLGVDGVGLELKSQLIDSYKEYQGKPINQHEFVGWPNIHPDPNSVKVHPLNAFEAQSYPYAVDNQLHFRSLSMFPQPHPYQYHFQNFQYFVVIDFEATCDKEKNPYPQEIIEFPSVIVSSMTGQLEACFQTYVRPTCSQLLSDFCKDLTGIQQIQVDTGVTLSEALLRHDKWLEKKGIKNTNFAIVTWSNWDCEVMLELECRYKKIRKPPYFNRWINLKVPFHKVFSEVRCNLKEAVQMAGLVWQGRPHCGLDDAKNTARLLALLMRKGFKFSITDSLPCPSTDDSFTWKLPPELHSLPSYQPSKFRNILVPIIQFHPHCYCGVKSSKGMVRKPGPKQGSLFFGCGNWTAAGGARCHYFVWASG